MTTDWTKYWASRRSTGDRLRDVDCCVDGKALASSDYTNLIALPVLELLDLDAGDTVLEIGCGTGLLLDEILHYCTKVYGTDIAADLLRSCPRRATVQVAPARSQPFPSEFFDKVAMVGVSLYMRDTKDFLDVIGEILRILKPQGRAVVSDVLLGNSAAMRSGVSYYNLDVETMAHFLSTWPVMWRLQAQVPSKRKLNRRYDLILDVEA